VRLTVAHQATVKAAHGRHEKREMWVLADPEVNAYLGSAGTVGEAWPHVQQICWYRRERRLKGKVECEQGYGITSLGPDQADAKRLLLLQRQYWGIENGLHWVRDVVLEEDRSTIRTGAAPQAVTTVRNLVLALVRRSGAANIAAALRTYSARPGSAVALVLSAGSA
jgi:hypothetical protein